MTDTTDSTTTDTPAADAPATDAVQAVADDTTALGGPVEEGDTPAAEEVADKVDDAADAADAPVIPETYDLTLPEGMALDADLLGEATPVFKEIGLTNEAANKLMPFAAKLLEKSRTSFETQMAEAGAAQRKTWLDEAKAAEDIGGAKWDATIGVAAKGLDAMGFKAGTPFRALLNDSGLGNHPDMIRAFAKLGELAGEEGDFARADAGAPGDALSEMYPNNRRSK